MPDANGGSTIFKIKNFFKLKKNYTMRFLERRQLHE